MTVIRPIDAAAGAAPGCGPGVITVQAQQKPVDESPTARRAREYTLTLPALRGIRATFFAVTTPIAVVDASYRDFPITHFRSFINPH
jgi:hypothetical protein